jgi:GNAT superfamily N-acetyltransferase
MHKLEPAGMRNLTMTIRPARRSDKREILSFCMNTFSWGDYIHRVWDYWYEETNGQIFVVESDAEKKIATSHVAICPEGKGIWLEGVRVHPDHRRSNIATMLVAEMLEYGRRKGANEASGIVGATNFPSQNMMEKNGFKILSKWKYYSAGGTPRHQESNARIANNNDIDDIWHYLQQSKIYSLSGKRYVKSWHWYTFDRTTLLNFVKEERVIVTGRCPIDGIAIINKRGYWDKTNVLQVVYLDVISVSSIHHVVSFITNLYLDGKFESVQIICCDSQQVASFADNFVMQEEEEFLLYNKQLEI